MARQENIQVSLRLRPLNSKQLQDNQYSIWKISKNTVSLKPDWLHFLQDQKRLSGISRSYSYNHCFSSKDSNSTLYHTMAQKVVLSSLQGYNGTIFVYGQTGSGKTYTMMGPEGCDFGQQKKGKIRQKVPVDPQKGIILLSLKELFDSIAQHPQRHYFFTCSYLEIYNQQVYDLLGHDEFRADVLSVNQDPQRGFYVKGLTEHVVSDMQQVLKYIQKGEANRKYAATAMNHHSSRSHTIFRLFVTSVMMVEQNEEQEGNITTESVLNFVDLAGSERVPNLDPENSSKRRNSNRSQSVQTLLNQGKYINTSLFYLCQVINRLSEKNTSKTDMHIPYRNSKLTKILRSSLGGNSLTSIICTATPTLSQFQMTLSTLRFGGTAKTITNKVAANIKSNKSAELLQTYQRDIQMLKKELELAQQGGRNKSEQGAMIKKHLQERIQRLTHMLFNQSVHQNAYRVLQQTGPIKSMDFWQTNVGDLIVSYKLVNQQNRSKYIAPELPPLKFQEKGLMNIERMVGMKRNIQRKEKEIQELTQQKSSLLDSKNNLKNDLKKALGLCKELSDKKQSYLNKAKILTENIQALEKKLGVLQRQDGIQNLEFGDLEILEQFFFRALDNVKNVKFRKKYQDKLDMLKHRQVAAIESPVKNKYHLEVWKQLGLPVEQKSLCMNSDDSLEFQTSFYRNKKVSQATSFESSDTMTMILGDIGCGELGQGISPIKGSFKSSGPLSECVQNRGLI